MFARKLHRLMVAVALLTVAVVAMIPALGEETQQVTVPNGPRVVINGDVWAAQHPPLRMKGVVLVPMREIFEALRADITWDSQAKMVLATRDGKRVQLWVGRPVAVVNNTPQSLRVPPIMVNDVVYVPADVAAAAFEGTAKWDAASETLTLTFPGEVLGQVIGTLVQIYPGPPGAMLLFDPAKSQYRALSLADKVGVQLQEIGQPGKAGKLEDLRPGDLLIATLDDKGAVMRIRAQYLTVEGTVGAVDQGTIMLKDGKTIKLMDVAQIVDEQGQAVPPDRLAAGARVRARVNPTTHQTSRLVMLQAAPATGQPKISAFTVVDMKRGYAPGATIKVRLMGTAGGQASFDVAGFVANRPMVEVQPGVYMGDWQVPQGAEEKPSTVIGHLKVGDQILTGTLQETFWIDGVAPVLGQKSPAPDSTVQVAKPTISVAYTEAGSGLDPQGVKMMLDGQDVTRDLTLGTGSCVYEVPDALADGVHRVYFEVADQAGNKSQTDWQFTVATQPAQKIEYVRHNAADPLARGERFEVEVGATEPARRCWVTVGPLRFELQPDADRRVFSGSHVVAAGEVVEQQRVTAFLEDDAGHQYHLEAGALATLRGDWPGPVVVLSPTEGQTVKTEFKVVGFAKPGSTVRVTVTYLKKRFLVFQGNLYQGTVTADEQGHWETPSIDPDQPLIGLSDSYKIIAELLDPEGEPQARVEVSLKG
ncbi:MAG: hypothetical protein J7M26_06630 [Armatimonadetes bacterium]|nr:hypothetical protein [Armatimonadota bacterium]